MECIGGYYCLCRPGYAGDRCQFGKSISFRVKHRESVIFCYWADKYPISIKRNLYMRRDTNKRVPVTPTFSIILFTFFFWGGGDMNYR